MTLEPSLVAAKALAPAPADSLLSVVLALIGLTLIALGLVVIFDRQERQEGHRMTHDLTFARRQQPVRRHALLMPTGDDLVRRVAERGGEIRLCRSTIQYRPPSVLTMEAKWIRDHCEELVRALAAPDPSDAGDAASIRILAEAGGWLEIARFELPRGANRAVVGWIVAP